jgi:hypothetical protein
MTLRGIRWRKMKMEMKSLEVKSKWYEALGMKSWEGPRVIKCVE